ncbi:uncharacterized protein LOC142352293 isoform X2 [Convolutriloba macropyga]|uniref:uncharacterized protein LOC142352293 isoform X2 n=1 Tax=Convolutriloba macropyga TaxID=536237 RepID=UPI003F52359D
MTKTQFMKKGEFGPDKVQNYVFGGPQDAPYDLLPYLRVLTILVGFNVSLWNILFFAILRFSKDHFIRPARRDDHGSFYLYISMLMFEDVVFGVLIIILHASTDVISTYYECAPCMDKSMMLDVVLFATYGVVICRMWTVAFMCLERLQFLNLHSNKIQHVDVESVGGTTMWEHAPWCPIIGVSTVMLCSCLCTENRYQWDHEIFDMTQWTLAVYIAIKFCAAYIPILLIAWAVGHSMKLVFRRQLMSYFKSSANLRLLKVGGVLSLPLVLFFQPIVIYTTYLEYRAYVYNQMVGTSRTAFIIIINHSLNLSIAALPANAYLIPYMKEAAGYFLCYYCKHCREKRRREHCNKSASGRPRSGGRNPSVYYSYPMQPRTAVPTDQNNLAFKPRYRGVGVPTSTPMMAGDATSTNNDYDSVLGRNRHPLSSYTPGNQQEYGQSSGGFKSEFSDQSEKRDFYHSANRRIAIPVSRRQRRNSFSTASVDSSHIRSSIDAANQMERSYERLPAIHWADGSERMSEENGDKDSTIPNVQNRESYNISSKSERDRDPPNKSDRSDRGYESA